MRCKYCGSKMLFPDIRHKHFSTGKAIAGAVTVGLVGAAAGFIGKDIKGYRCSTCGTFSEQPMDFGEESLIDSAVRDARRKGASLSYERYCEKYRGIEQVPLQSKSNETFTENTSSVSYIVETRSDSIESADAHDVEDVKNAYRPNKYVRGCPVFVETVTIEESAHTNMLRMSIRNVSQKVLRSVYFKVTAYDDVGDPLSECSCVYQGMTANAGAYLPADKVFDLRTEAAYKIAIICEKAAFTDDSVWRMSDDSVEYELREVTELTPQNFPQYKYLSALLAEKSKLSSVNKLYMPAFEDDYRMCVCGTPVAAGECCPTCGLDEETLAECIDYDTLLEYRHSLIKQVAQKRAKQTQELFVSTQDKTYQTAKSLMETSTQSYYDTAKEMFWSIAAYKDAAELAEECEKLSAEAEKKSIYDQGKALLMKRNHSIKDIEAALAEFKKISGWKDTDEQIGICEQQIKELKAKEEADRLERERKEEIERKEAERIAKRNKTIAIIITSIVCAIIVFLIIWTTVIIPNGKYNDALALMNAGKYAEAIAKFEVLGGYKDSVIMLTECREAILAEKTETQYQGALSLINAGKHGEAIMALNKVGDYKDTQSLVKSLWDKIAVRDTLCTGSSHTVGLKVDGTVVTFGTNYDGQCNVSAWRNIVAICCNSWSTYGLKADGTVVAVGRNQSGQCNVKDWKDIVAIAADGDSTVGLKADGTVVAVGYDAYGKLHISNWKDIIAISVGLYHTVGLKADGTVVAVGRNQSGQCNVKDWKDIVAIAADGNSTVGLKADGTVVAVGDIIYGYGKYSIPKWKDIVSISADSSAVFGVKRDGTVVAVGPNGYGQININDWKEIVSVSGGTWYTVGLKADGTVVAVGDNRDGQCNVSSWKNIKVPN